jgi:uncharacterized YigZ family protein
VVTERSRTIAGSGSNELVVKKSRFICNVARVKNEDEARDFVMQMKKRYWDASHNCSAWVIGQRGELQRSNDDGEPSGTAGIPMLNVLNQRKMTDTIAVGTRYFGGILLGAGGLVRAYGRSVSEAIDRVGIVERRQLTIVAVEATHEDAGRLDHALRASPFHIAGTSYGASVTFALHLDAQSLPAFESWLAQTTGGRCTGKITGIEIVEIPLDR